MSHTSPKCRNCFDCDLKSPLFRLLSDEELKNLNTDRYEVEYKAGDSIFKQGSAANNILSLTKGKVKLYLEGLNDQNLIFKVSKPWELLGGPGLFIDNRHHCSARAIEPSTVCFINLDRFKEVICSNPEFGKLFMREQSENTVHLYHRFLSNSQKHMNGRLADALLYLASEIYIEPITAIFLSTHDLAELSGMTRDSVVRVLKNFTSENLIDIQDKGIVILNKEKLEELSRLG